MAPVKPMTWAVTFLRMKRARLQPRQIHLAQPFTDRSRGDSDCEPPSYLLAQIYTAPAHHFVLFGGRPLDRQFLQFRHLRLRQQGRMSAEANRAKPRYPFVVVAMHPVPQGLPIHPRPLGRLPTRMS